MDAKSWWADLFTADTQLRYANNPEIRGDAARDMFDQTFQELDLCDHRLEYFDYCPPRIYQALKVKYRIKGDSPSQDIELPGFVTLFVEEDQHGDLKCYRTETFLDPTPVFGRIAEKKAGSTK